MTQILCTKKFKEFKAGLFEILRIGQLETVEMETGNEKWKRKMETVKT